VGQKVHPKGFRLGIIEEWDSVWYANKSQYPNFLHEDLKLRKFLKNKLFRAGISRIKIARRANQIEINIYTARPGIIIGRGGKDVAVIRDELVRMTGKQIQLNISEEGNVEMNALLVAENIAAQLEKRVSFRRAMKQAIMKILRSGAKGVKICCGGRLDGAEIARSEWYRRGRVPLHTLRAKIDYGFAESMTLFGKIGIKVWIYKGDVLKKESDRIQENAKAKSISVQEVVS